MAELLRGTVLDRPWGKTLAALGLRGLTGQLTVVAEGAKLYQVAFQQGVVVAATSPLASDAAIRIAMTLGLVSSTTVADVAKKQAAQAGAVQHEDDVGALAERTRMAPELAMRLRRRAIAQRAARTFSVESGDFVVDDRVTLSLVPGAAVDIRTVVYLGAKSLISAGRLDRELGQMGAWFQIKPESVEDLRQFGFGESERALLEPLTRGAGLGELEATGADQRVVRAVVYALGACGALNVEMTARAPAKRTPTMTPPAGVATAAAEPPRRTPTMTPPAGVAVDAAQRRLATMTPPGGAPTARSPRKTAAPVRNEAAASEVEGLIKERLAILDGKADHFALLGVPREATPGQVRTAYLALARQLHPDRLAALGVADEGRRAQRLFAEVNTAFAILSDTRRRDEYLEILSRGGADAIREEQAQAEAMTQRVLESEEAFRKGEQALRRDQIPVAIRELERAVALNPDEADYQAALAWAKFVGAADKGSIASATRATLQRTIQLSPRAPAPKFYLGRIERILGRDAEAIALFQEVLKRAPNHAEAASELRVLEAKQADKAKEPSGLFSRLKRKTSGPGSQ